MHDDNRHEPKTQKRHPRAANDNDRSAEVDELYEMWPDGGLSDDTRSRAPLVAVLFDGMSNGDPRLTVGMLSALLLEVRLYMFAVGNPDVDDTDVMVDALWMISKRLEATMQVAMAEVPLRRKPPTDAA